MASFCSGVWFFWSRSFLFVAAPQPPGPLDTAGTPVWSQRGVDASHSGMSPFRGPSIADRVRVAWRYATPGQVRSSPAITAEGHVVIGVGKDLVALAPATGEVLWRFSTGAWVSSSPTIDALGVVYVGSQDGHVYALRPPVVVTPVVTATGSSSSSTSTAGRVPSVVWEFDSGMGVQSSPTLSPNGSIVYIGSDNGNVYALTAASGARVWNFTTGKGVITVPAVSPLDGSIVVGSQVGSAGGLPNCCDHTCREAWVVQAVREALWNLNLVHEP